MEGGKKEKEYVLTSGLSFGDSSRVVFERFYRTVGRNIIVGIIASLGIFVTLFIVVPILSQKPLTSLMQSIGPFIVGGILFGIYLSLLYSIEGNELIRYVSTLLLGLSLIVLPFLNIWQLKYGYDPTVGTYRSYTGPPLIPEGWDPVVNPLITGPWSESYLDGVKGYSPFINFGTMLIILAGVLTLIFSVRFIYLERANRLTNYVDDYGTLSTSQESYRVRFKPLPTLIAALLLVVGAIYTISQFGQDIFVTLTSLFIIVLAFYLYQKVGIHIFLFDEEFEEAQNKKQLRSIFQFDLAELHFRIAVTDEETVYSLNRMMQVVSGTAILGLVFVFLGLEGFIGLENFLAEPGFYLTFIASMHVFYLGSEPSFRFQLRKSKLAYGFVMPTVLMLIFELYIPILVALYLSFQDIRQEPIAYYNLSREAHNVGFENYQFLVNSDLLWIVVAFFGSTIVFIKLWRFVSSFRGGTAKLGSQFLLFLNYIFFLFWSIGLTLVPRYERFIDQKSSLFIDPSPIPVFVNTIVWTVASVVSHLIIGITLALLMNTEFRGRGVVRSLMIIPWAVPNFITISIFAAFIFDTDAGAVNLILRILHLQPYDWMASDNIMMTAILVNIWLGYPFIMVAVLAALQSIPTEIYEAAEIDGATRLTKFFKITLPLIKPTVFVISLLGFLWTFNLFNVIYLLTLDKLSVLAVEDYYILIVYIFAVFRGGNWSIAATFSFVLFLLVAAFSWIYTKAVGKGPYEI